MIVHMFYLMATALWYLDSWFVCCADIVCKISILMVTLFLVTVPENPNWLENHKKLSLTLTSVLTISVASSTLTIYLKHYPQDLEGLFMAPTPLFKFFNWSTSSIILYALLFILAIQKFKSNFNCTETIYMSSLLTLSVSLLWELPYRLHSIFHSTFSIGFLVLCFTNIVEAIPVILVIYALHQKNSLKLRWYSLTIPIFFSSLMLLGAMQYFYSDFLTRGSWSLPYLSLKKNE
jgi:hypothetical protein